MLPGVAFLVLATLYVLSETEDAPRVQAASQFTTIKVAAEALRSPVNAGATLADAIGTLTAIVDGEVCQRVDLRGPSNTDSEGNKVIVVGAAGQPSACLAPTGTITIRDQRGRKLVSGSFAIQPGATYVLSNLAPEAPIDPDPGQRGMLRVTLTDADGRPLSGNGSIMPPNPSLLIIPVDTVQPVAVGLVVSFLHGFDEQARVLVTLPVGPYLVTYSNTDFRLADAPESITVQTGSRSIRFPAVRVSVASGLTSSLPLSAVADPLIPAGASITAPRAGDGVLPPGTGEAGLK